MSVNWWGVVGLACMLASALFTITLSVITIQIITG